MNDNAPFAPQWAARLAAAAGVGASGALGVWIVGDWRWLAFGEAFVPIAPMTAILVFLLAAATWTRARHPGAPPPRASHLAGAAALLLSVAVLVSYATGTILPVESWLARTEALRSGSPVGRTSAYTATLALLLAIAVLGQLAPPKWRSRTPVPTTVVAAVSAVVLHAYSFGFPLMYGNDSVPVAALTAFLLLLVATALLLLSSSSEWPLRVLIRRDGQSITDHRRILFRWIVVLLAGFLSVSGYLWFNEERAAATARAIAANEEVIESMAGEVEERLDRKLKIAQSVRLLGPGGSDALNAALRTPGGTPQLRRWLEGVRAGADFESASLVTLDGRVLASASILPVPTESRFAYPIPRGVSDTGVVVDDSRLWTERRIIYWVPLDGSARSATSLCIALVVDIRRHILPIVARDRPGGLVGRTVLWRVRGDSAMAMVDDSIGRRTRVATAAWSALNPERTAPRKAVTGWQQRPGTAPSLVTIRPLQGGQWVLTIIMEPDELAAPAARAALRTTLVLLPLLLSLTSVGFFAWTRWLLATANRELQLVRERDVSEVRRAELDRMLGFRSAIAQTVARADSIAELFELVCKAATAVGGYRLAWVGQVHHDEGRSVKVVASKGATGFLDDFSVSWAAEHPMGNGPTGRAVRSGRVEVTQDTQRDPGHAPWRKTAQQHELGSVCAVPLKVRGEVIASLTLAMATPGAFHAEELALLAAIATDLEAGLTAIDDRQRLIAQSEQLQLFRSVMDRSTDLILVADPATMQYVDCNASVVSALGYTVDEIRQLGPTGLVVDLPDADTALARLDKIRQTGANTRTTALRRKDGRLVPVEVRITPVEVAGRPLVLGIARDITARMAAEEERDSLRSQVVQAQRMESVGRLAGGVAHDFNNLLTVINGTADLALADAAHDAPHLADLRDIRAAGERAATLTRQLLAFSRQQVLHPVLLDLNEVITSFMGMLRRVIGEHIEVVTTFAGSSAPVVADQGQFEQVLMNLCVNARDAMVHGGRLTIGVTRATIDHAGAQERPPMRPGEYILVTVSDTGHGMSEEVLGRVFEPFFSTKAPGKGTGLGLSTCYGIVRQSGGHIWASSEVGVGSTFQIYLPFAPASAQPIAPTATQAAIGGSETILIVEDEEAIRFVARRVLERAGYTVLDAGSGEEALALLDAHRGPLDLVMSDVVMPGISGVELARRLRESHPALRVVLASGYSDEVIHGESDIGRELRVIGKPYSLHYLLQEIRRALDGGEPSSAPTPGVG